MEQHIWSGDGFGLDAYLDRIGFEGERAPTARTLRALHRAHTLSLPFENLEVLFGREVPLDLPSLERKLLRSPRGGYCYEHISLFAAALERLGFGVTALAGRVRMGMDKILPTTHALLRVETAPEADGTSRVWLCDVGFGASPLVPLELADGAEESEGDWHYRLRHEREVTPGAEGWVLSSWEADSGSWLDRHDFTLTPQYPVDFEVGNHFIATHPRSPFVPRAFVQRVFPDRLHVLDGNALTVFRPGDGTRETRDIPPRELPEALDELFGIRLDGPDARALAASSGRRVAPAL